jgi:hypothetical protein
MTRSELECLEYIYSEADNYFYNEGGNPELGEEFWELFQALPRLEECDI